MAEIKDFLLQQEREGLLRTLKPISSRQNSKIEINNKEYIDFSSNDYLGLSGHPKLIAASKEALDKYGTSSSASRLLSGDSDLYHRLEEKIAQLKNKESALVFNSGFQANLGIISALFGAGDCVFSDRLNHASIIDGIMLSGARIFRFKHNDVEHLEQLLKEERNKFKNALIITETIFSMDGDRAPLKNIVALKDKYNCQIFVDEAHATGIFGKNGSGVVEEDSLSGKIDFIMGTFGKALGGFGAYLAASKEIIDYLINTCRSFIYSTALPPAIIASNIAALELLKEELWRREKLLELADYFRVALKVKGFEVKGCSQIIPVIIGDNFKTIELAKKLQDQGYWVLPVRPPTVPKGQARLRFSLSANHSKEILDKLIKTVSSVDFERVLSADPPRPCSTK